MMFHSMTKSFRLSKRGNFWTSLARSAGIFALVLLLPLVASAYTVVMRDGRRIEIPSTFILTPTTLTYEVAPGINITLQMSAIDVAATERANREPAGSLLRRAGLQTMPESPARQRAARTITNRDLEAARRAREASEAAYEQRRRELGLPSLAETQRRAEEESARARAALQQSLSEDEEAESYWRARASELRAEIAALDAQIDYERGLLAALPTRPAIGSYTVLTSVVPLVPGLGVPVFPRGNIWPHGPIVQPGFAGHPALMPRGPRFGPSGQVGHAGVFVAPNVGPQLTARVGFGGGATRGQVFLNTLPYGRGFGHRSVFPRGIYAPQVPLLGSTYSNDAFYDYDRETIIQRLRELESERAGLRARWRVLEDEARRAGALPGWLRP